MVGLWGASVGDMGSEDDAVRPLLMLLLRLAACRLDGGGGGGIF